MIYIDLSCDIAHIYNDFLLTDSHQCIILYGTRTLEYIRHIIYNVWNLAVGYITIWVDNNIHSLQSDKGLHRAQY